MGKNKEEEEELDRGTWSGKLDFLLSCIGYAVGIGNVWRFPYLVYRNGGATFLIPYIIMLIIAGLPLFFIELAIGQFASEGPITVWKVSPAFSGIGFGMCIVSGMVAIYYNIIIMYAIYYMFVSFVHLDDQLPWQSCDHDYNTAECRTEPYPALQSMNETEKLKALNSSVVNITCVADKFLANLTDMYNTNITVGDLNSTMLSNELVADCKYKWQTASEQYWTRYVLQLQDSNGINDIGGVSLRNCLCLFFTWLLIFFCLIKGIKSTGKVVYFTAIFPYVILTVLFIRGVTLEGAWKGLAFYLIPQPEKLLSAKVWGDAATQIFYSLGIGFGGLLTMSSYNRFKNNVYRDAILVSCINCGTSIFAGFAIFSVIGFMATVTNQDVENVASQGPGLAFIAYPEGIARLPVAPVWAFLFFFMLLTLGMDSQFATMETLISGITDIFPHYLRKRKLVFTFCCCMAGFLLGIPMTCKGGIYVMTLMDWYTGSYNLMFIALMELICLMYVYGYNKFSEDVEMMVGIRPNIYWKVTWCGLTPLALIFILVISGVEYAPAGYGGVIFDDWAQVVGWLLASFPVVAFFVVFAVQVYRYGGLKNAVKETDEWGPALPENRTIPRYNKGVHLYGQDNGALELPTNSPPPYDVQHEKGGMTIMTQL